MKVLAIDSSTSCAGICILKDNKILAELNINNDKKTHSEKLFNNVETLIKEFNLKVEDFDLFSVVKGPGSFTGLRIGITLVKTFAYLYNKPVVGLNTLDVMSYNFPFSEKLICPMIDARNSNVYTAIYKNNGKINRISEYMGVHIEELIEILKEKNEPVIFMGDGIDKNKEFLLESLKDKCIIVTENLKYQKISSLASLAFDLYSNGECEDAFSLKPFYLRKSQAERIRDEKQNKK
jgi:tRNA threonylcarbamoyladenosine biosynthesis protein TsaB